MNRPLNPIEAAYLLTMHANRIETAVLKVRTYWPFATTPTADRLLYEQQQQPRTWLQRTVNG